MIWGRFGMLWHIRVFNCDMGQVWHVVALFCTWQSVMSCHFVCWHIVVLKGCYNPSCLYLNSELEDNPVSLVIRCLYDHSPTIYKAYTAKVHKSAMQDSEAACSTYSLAVQKLQASIQFTRGDIAPYNALGDAYAGWAERLPDGSAEQVLKLGNALHEGYLAALHVSANSSEALIGVAETKGKMGRLSRRSGSNDALQQFLEGAQAYQKALQAPNNLGSLQERNEARYNLACYLCLSAQPEAALMLLAELLQKDGITVQDLITDEDFFGLRQLPAFQHLIQQAQHTLKSM